MKKEKAFHKKAIAANDHIQLAIADLLELLSLKYCPTPNIVNPGEALSYVLVKEIPDKLKKKFVKDFERSKIFQPNTKPLKFLTFINIKSLDVPILKKLLKKIPCFPTSRRRTCPTLSSPNKVLCCGECSHPCPLCKKEDCESNCPNKLISWNHPCANCSLEKTECISEHCANCGNKTLADQCGISNSSEGIDFLKENRNTIFHLTLIEINEFIKGRNFLQGFRNEKSLFKHILRNYLSIVNFIANRNHFQEKAITFDERRKRIDELTAILFRESEVSDNLSRQCLFLTEQIHLMQEKIDSFQMEESCNGSMSVSLEMCNNTGCKLLVRNVNVTKLWKLRIRQTDLHNTEEFIEEDDYNILGKGDSSILDISHKVVKNYKYQYQIIFEDDNGKRWRSIYNHDLSHPNLLWLKDDRLDFLVMSSKSMEIINLQLHSKEKLPFGLKSVLHFEGEYSVTKFVEFKHFKSNEWRRLTTFTIEPQENNQYTFQCTFGECDVYDIRCLVETKDGRYHMFTMDKITIVGEDAFEHQRSVDDTSLMLHPIGDNNDSYDSLQNVLAGRSVGGGTSTMINVKIKSPGGGLTTRNLSKMGSYIDQNYKHQPYVCFPPLYMVADATRMAKVFDDYLRKKIEEDSKEGRFIMLPAINLLKDLKTLGYSPQQIHELFGDDLKLNSVCNILFDMENATVYITTPCENVQNLKNAYQQSDRNMKALLTITQGLHGKSPVKFVGLIGCFNSTKDEIDNSDFICRSCTHWIISSNDCESEEAIGNWFRCAIRQIRRHVSVSTTCNDSMTILADRLMILAAIEDYSLPATCVATDEEKLERLVLTSAQIKAVFEEENKRKVIKGNFGSGKTLVMKKTLEHLIATKQRDDIIYYINWDPYSLINVEMLHSPTPTNVIFTNVCQISEDAKSHEVISLSRCFQHIADRHNDKTVHILIDELDEDELDANEISKLKTTLTSASFKRAMISISVQSIKKHRKWCFGEGAMHTAQFSWEECGMTIYNLPTTMRFTNKIHDVIIEIQKAISATEDTYYIRGHIPKDQTQIPQPSTHGRQRENQTTSRAVEITESFPSEVSNVQEEDATTSIEQTPLKPPETIDKLAKQVGEFKPIHIANSLRLVTHLQFMNCQSGHSIIGEVPQILRLDLEEVNYNVIESFIRDYCLLHQEKSLVVCNDLQLMSTLVAVFNEINIPIIEYYHDLLNNVPPSVADQKKAYNHLTRKDDSTLLFLADNRGCRGLEYKNVICVMDERHEFERGALVEILCRATAQLSIISFRDSQIPTQISAIVDSLTTKLLEDVTEKCIENSRNCPSRVRPISNEKFSQETRQQSNRKLEAFALLSGPSSVTEEDLKRIWTFTELEELLQTGQFNKLQNLLELRPQLLELRSVGRWNLRRRLHETRSEIQAK